MVIVNNILYAPKPEKEVSTYKGSKMFGIAMMFAAMSGQSLYKDVPNKNINYNKLTKEVDAIKRKKSNLSSTKRDQYIREFNRMFELFVNQFGTTYEIGKTYGGTGYCGMSDGKFIIGTLTEIDFKGNSVILKNEQGVHACTFVTLKEVI